MDDLSRITISDTSYPIKCDNYVLSKIQNEYETIGNFEALLTGKRRNEDKEKGFDLVEPNVDACNKFLYWCICEGLEIEADLQNKPAEIPTEKAIIRSIDINIYTLSLELTKEFYRSLNIKK